MCTNNNEEKVRERERGIEKYTHNNRSNNGRKSAEEQTYR